jgi:hypothetical protein
MQQEQEREEKRLKEKEQQFFVVDRLGLVMLLQKYCALKKGRKVSENRMELEILKKYFSNREYFDLNNEEHTYQGKKSPSKTTTLNQTISS